jgi:hypothetical protein
MERKLPSDAFEYYLSLGLKRSYAMVAVHFGVSKVAVTNLATKEGWQARIRAHESQARATTDKKHVESLEEVRDRHLRAARLMQVKALEALRTMRLDDAMSAVKALELGVRTERLLLGEPTERTESVAALIRGEYERWMTEVDQPEPAPEIPAAPEPPQENAGDAGAAA